MVFASDHGSHFCTRNKEYKRSCHDGCTHIPLVIAGPGFSGGRACERTERIYDPDTLLPYEARSLEVLTRGIASELRRPCASRAAAALRLSVVARQLEDAAEVFSEGARRMAELDLEHYDDRECDLTFDTTKVVDDVSHD